MSAASLTVPSERESFLSMIRRLSNDAELRSTFHAAPIATLVDLGITEKVAREWVSRMYAEGRRLGDSFDSKIVLCSSSGY